MSLWVQREFGRLGSLAPAVDALHEFKSENGQMVATSSATWKQWLEGFNHDLLSRQYVHETIEALNKAVHSHNAAVTAALAPVLTPRHPSQLYQSVMEGLIVFLMLCWIWRKPQKPGVSLRIF